MKKYITTHQYEPLQVPDGWGEDGRRLVNRLTEIFDDIYRRYGRLGLEDVSKAFGEALDAIRQQVRAADAKAEKAQYAAAESFSAANNASGLAVEALEKRYQAGDCLVTAREDDPAGRLAGDWERLGEITLQGGETLNVWRRVR